MNAVSYENISPAPDSDPLRRFRLELERKMLAMMQEMGGWEFSEGEKFGKHAEKYVLSAEKDGSGAFDVGFDKKSIHEMVSILSMMRGWGALIAQMSKRSGHVAPSFESFVRRQMRLEEGRIARRWLESNREMERKLKQLGTKVTKKAHDEAMVLLPIRAGEDLRKFLPAEQREIRQRRIEMKQISLGLEHKNPRVKKLREFQKKLRSARSSENPQEEVVGLLRYLSRSQDTDDQWCAVQCRQILSAEARAKNAEARDAMAQENAVAGERAEWAQRIAGPQQRVLMTAGGDEVAYAGKTAHNLAIAAVAKADGTLEHERWAEWFQKRVSEVSYLRDKGLARILREWNGVIKNSTTIPKERGEAYRVKGMEMGDGSRLIYWHDSLNSAVMSGSLKAIADEMLTLPVPEDKMRVCTKKTNITEARYLHLPLSMGPEVPDELITDQVLLDRAVVVARLGFGIDLARHRVLIFRHNEKDKDADAKHHAHIFVDRLRDDGTVLDYDAFQVTRTLHLATQFMTALFLQKNGAKPQASYSPPVSKSDKDRGFANKADARYPKVGSKDGFRVGFLTQENPSDYHEKCTGGWQDDEKSIALMSRGELLKLARDLGHDGIESLMSAPGGFCKLAKRAKQKSSPYENCSQDMTTHTQGNWKSVPTDIPIRATNLVEHLAKRLIQPGKSA